jgi:hypothetical protein
MEDDKNVKWLSFGKNVAGERYITSSLHTCHICNGNKF